MKKISGKIIRNCILILTLILLYLSVYIFLNFKDVSLEQLLYSIQTSKGTSIHALKEGISFVFSMSFITLLIIGSFFFIQNKVNKKIELRVNIKNKTKTIPIFPLTNKGLNIALGIFFLFTMFLCIKLLKIDIYLKNQLSSSNFIEKYYINPQNVEFTFPEEKQNLIYIYLESLEMTNASLENGGLLKISHIPNLENLALNNLNFSNKYALGGAYQLTGNSWTIGAMVGQTAGIPLKVPIDYNSYLGYGEFLPGTYTLGEVLEDNGYKNYLMIGSDADFGGRSDYFTYHGNYTIYDYKYAKEQNWIEDDYYVWWGYEDKKLYQFAKQQLLEISKKDEPFNFTMLTVDTHFTDGYLDETCPDEFDLQYTNVIYCADIMINDFINWIKEQDFYDNTTIIITGDHLTMQTGYYDYKKTAANRVIYNAFINSNATPINPKQRIFTTIDMYPTTLAALGVTFKENRLGLGTNLFSDKKTLTEEFGYDYLDTELQKNSYFYNHYLLGDSYIKMQENVEHES